MSLLVTRLTAALALFGITFAIGIIPVLLIKIWMNRKQSVILALSKSNSSPAKEHYFVQLLLFFGGGVLLSTCFVHLIPEVRENYEKYSSKISAHHHHDNITGNNGDLTVNNSNHHFNHNHNDDYNYHAPNQADTNDYMNFRNFDPNLDHDNEYNSNPDFQTSFVEDYPSDNDNRHKLSLKSNQDHAHSNNLHSDHSHDVHSHDDHSHNDNDNDNHSHHNQSIDNSLSVEAALTDNHNHTHSHSTPYVELAICGGFFLIYFLEVIIHLFIRDHVGHSHHRSDSDREKMTHLQASSFSSSSEANRVKPPLTHQSSSSQLIVRSKVFEPSNGFDNLGADLSNEISSISYPASYNSCLDITNKPQPSTHQLEIFNVPFSVRFIRGFVTILAFSAHSIFDGVAIGLQETRSQIWTIFFAISIHKLVVAFAIGLELFDQVKSLALTTFHMALFSLTSPVGIIIVIITQQKFSEKESPIMTLLSATATGTILYILFFEILQTDSGSKVSKFVQFVSVLIGFLVMTAVILSTDH